jgi:hypothetical protein
LGEFFLYSIGPQPAQLLALMDIRQHLTVTPSPTAGILHFPTSDDGDVHLRDGIDDTLQSIQKTELRSSERLGGPRLVPERSTDCTASGSPIIISHPQRGGLRMPPRGGHRLRMAPLGHRYEPALFQLVNAKPRNFSIRRGGKHGSVLGQLVSRRWRTSSGRGGIWLPAAMRSVI